MERKRSLGKSVVLGCGVLIGLLIVLAVAGYGILRAVGGARSQSALARLKASGAPTTWEEAIPPPVPDEQNAALLYEKAFEAMVDPTLRAEQDALDAYVSPADPEKRRKFDKQIGDILANNAEALRYAAQAAQRPKFRFETNWEDPTALSYREFSWFKRLTRLSCAQATVLADRGDLSGAVETWRINLAILDHLGSDPRFLAQLSRYSTVAFASPWLRQALQDYRFSAQQCRSLDEAVEALDLTEGLVKCLHAERIQSLQLMDQARGDPETFALYSGGPALAPGERRPMSRAFVWFGYRAISPLDRAAMLRVWEKGIALARKPYRESAAGFEALDSDLPRFAVVTRSYARLPAHATRARDWAAATLGQMRTALGLAAYRTQFGGYPDSLEELRKALNWEVPEDPFSGKDFIYRREGKGYLLYSLGPDLDDDGGRAKPRGLSSVGGASDCDIVWRVER